MCHLPAGPTSRSVPDISWGCLLLPTKGLRLNVSFFSEALALDSQITQLPGLPIYPTHASSSPAIAIFLLLPVTFQAQLNQAINQLWVLEAGCRPQLRIHADR